MEGKWLYDITLDGDYVGDQGDAEFDTKDEAIEDAKDFIHNALLKEYKRENKDFSIECYQAAY